MSMENQKTTPSPATAKSKPVSTSRTLSNAKPPLPPLFRTIDWVTFFLTTLVVFVGYLATLAPDLTLEDSGELAVGSFYAGVPHPPGYPIWTIYTWLFTVLVPISNIAFRVALSSAVAGALSCGLIGLMVSRGSSMIVEGMAELKNLERRWENALCVVSGLVAGMIMGFNGFFWSQAIIVEVYTFSALSMVGVLCCLMRWIYAPTQNRYLYLAFFAFAICANNHQSLVVAAMGIEFAIILVNPKLGRDLLLGNSLCYFLGLILKANRTTASLDNTSIFIIFNLVGLWSISHCVWLVIKTKGLLSEWKSVLSITGVLVAGLAFYFFLPITSMTNPPMNWGYPRTVEGFFHALTRGQYDRVKPSGSFQAVFDATRVYWEGAVEEFNIVYLLIAVVPFFFFFRMQKRERNWMAGLLGIFLCLGVLLDVLINPSTDKQSRDLVKVFFTASYVMLAMWIGYGLTLIGGLLATQYERYRYGLICAGAVAAGFAIYGLSKALESANPYLHYPGYLGVILAAAFVAALLLARSKAPMPILLAVFALMPAHTALSHWWDNEQHGHLFGFWFGHDMFTPPFNGKDGKPLYPEMTRDTILFGGTDPGRFCPTYMIFCESFIPPAKRRDPKFDRRDVYIITQNALADATYLSYIRAHYNRSAQNDPPFFENFFGTKLLKPLDSLFLGIGERVEKSRRAQGVYPPKEIITPSLEDSASTFKEYMDDFQKRLQNNQLKPGEDFRVVNDGGQERIQVSGQVSVMQINGLLTKIIFDKNPTNEFFVEESFPLDWMFEYLTPFGIIMKINRQPVPEFTDDICQRDHEFWGQYMNRMIGDWITYDTPVKDVCAFTERVYIDGNFKGFKGDLKFLRDNDAQKAFSKLRSAIGGLYSWRLDHSKTPAEQQRIMKEADYAFKQAFALCPFSPEATFRYVNLLARMNRLEDALVLARTCYKFDPENKGVIELVKNLESMRQNQNTAGQLQTQVAELEKQYRANPNNLQTGLNLAAAYSQLQMTNQAVAILDKLIEPMEQQVKASPSNAQLVFGLVSVYLQHKRSPDALRVLDQFMTDPKLDALSLLTAAQAYAQMGQVPKLEGVLSRLVQLDANNAEAWFDLASVQISLGKQDEAMQSLNHALPLSTQRLARQPGAKDLVAIALSDPRFASIRLRPEFQKLIAK